MDERTLAEQAEIVRLKNMWIRNALARESQMIHLLTEYVQKFNAQLDARRENYRDLAHINDLHEKMIDDTRDRMEDLKDAMKTVTSCLN